MRIFENKNYKYKRISYNTREYVFWQEKNSKKIFEVTINLDSCTLDSIYNAFESLGKHSYATSYDLGYIGDNTLAESIFEAYHRKNI